MLTARSSSACTTVARVTVILDDDERERYEHLLRPFDHLVRSGASDEALARHPDGERALQGFRRAVALAASPRAKRRALASILARHRAEGVLLFAPSADAAYELAEELLLPVLTPDIGASERRRNVARFEEGLLRGLVVGGLLLEELEAFEDGAALPVARIAVVLSSLLPTRRRAGAAAARVGRLLRGEPRRTVYELVTRDTVDEPAPAASSARLAAAREVRP